MALVFTTTRQASALHGVKVCVYSRAGIGKTVLCSTAPAPIIISAEKGLLSLRNLDIPVIEVSTVDDLTEVHLWAQTSKEAKQFKTLCIDSITEVAEVILSNAKSQVKDPRQAYGELIEKMDNTIKAFRDLPGYNVYMSAKESKIKDESNGVVLCGPSMPGAKLGPALPYYFDEVFNLGMGKAADGTDYRYLRTQPDFQYDAKDRSGALDPVEPPDLTHIFNKIIGVPA